MTAEQRNTLAVDQTASAVSSVVQSLNMNYQRRDALQHFLASRGSKLSVPTAAEISTYLEGDLKEHKPATAFARFSHLQAAAALVWGTQETSHFAMVLRDARVKTKNARLNEWERAASAIKRLPPEWRHPMMNFLRRSRDNLVNPSRGIVWSASYTTAVARALARWWDYCAETGTVTLPSGTSLEAFARYVHNDGEDCAVGSTSHYLTRIYSGFRTVLRPGYSSNGCQFVVDWWREKGKALGTPTKSGSQYVTASAIYAHGFEIMATALRSSMYGIRSATAYRNGLLLAIAIALPQRARALSVLEFGTTLKLLERPSIQIKIPGNALKVPEADKSNQKFERVFNNDELWDAIEEYVRTFRPLFDQGSMLFPSVHAQGGAISEARIGTIAGDLLLEKFGVRISVHLLRDNVATEASESMASGARTASSLLAHRDETTTQRNYDRAVGVKAVHDYEDFLSRRRRKPTGLLIWEPEPDEL
jgi:integrase